MFVDCIHEKLRYEFFARSGLIQLFSNEAAVVTTVVRSLQQAPPIGCCWRRGEFYYLRYLWRAGSNLCSTYKILGVPTTMARRLESGFVTNAHLADVCSCVRDRRTVGRARPDRAGPTNRLSQTRLHGPAEQSVGQAGPK